MMQLDRIRKVYEFDIKNVYARAYEERILIMMMEKEVKCLCVKQNNRPLNKWIRKSSAA